MTTRPTRTLLAAGALATIGAAAAAQTLATAATSPADAPPIARTYHLTLRSTWPQLGSSERCRNGGDETVEGTLARHPDGTYRGTLERRTVILFCGAHGAMSESCDLRLEGGGAVAMTGVVLPDQSSPSGRALRVAWHPADSGRVATRGACSAEFKRSVEEMYRTVPHGAEFALPVAGEKSVERLENYAWTVELR